MLSISKPLSPERAAWYFERDDYYLAQEGEWYGKISEELHLSGPIKREDFLNLLQGFDQKGEKLVASAGAKDVKNDDGTLKRHGHRSGIDMTFSAPKSVSILSYHDSRINDAFKNALKTSLDHIEQEFAHTQTKDKSGAVHAEKTDKLLWSTFVHDTSRELDPQLHCHCVLLNLTQDATGKMKTLQNDPLYKNKMHLGQHFRSELAKEIQKIGYQIDVTDRKKGFFEIRGVGEEVLQAFSKRSEQVKEEVKSLRNLEFKDLKREHLLEWAKERNRDFANSPDYETIVEQETKRLSQSSEKVYSSYSDGKLAAIATTNSRVAKRDVSREYVTATIENTCKKLNTSLSILYEGALKQSPPETKGPGAGDILKDALTGVTEGQSTFTKIALITEAMKMGIGAHTYEDFEKEFNLMRKSKEVSLLGTIETKAGAKEVYSSKEMIEVENSVIAMCREAKGKSSIGVDKSTTDAFIKHTDINLKMKSALEISEKDPVKADYKFKAVLSKIEDPQIKAKFIQLRNLALKNSEDPASPTVDAVDHPELHQYFEKFGYGFTPGQKDALRLIASTKDVFSVIQGDAGTGKSFSCLYSKQLLEEHGFIVKGFAPTGKATTGLAVAADIFESNYSTIDSFLLKYKNSDPEKRQAMYSKGKEIWVVDEAGMCGSRKFLDLMTVAQEAQAKVVFIGDRKQFQSIEAGKMFSELQDRSGIDMVIMPDVMRQKTAQTKEIVKAISLKDIDFAFNVMQGFKKAPESFDKNDTTCYSIGTILQFTKGYNGLTPETRCTIKRVGESLTLEYFDEESRVFKNMEFNPRIIAPADFDVYKPPLNHHALSDYTPGETLTLSIPEQGVPATTATITEVSDKNLTIVFSDPSTGEKCTVAFDPSKNPENIMHKTASGNEKRSTGKESYENMITVESDHAKCRGLVAQDYLASIAARKDVLLITGTNKDKDALNEIIRPELVKQGIISDSKEFNAFQTKSLSGTAAMAANSYKEGQVIITNDKCGNVPKGTQAEIVGINGTDNTVHVKFWNKDKKQFVTSDIDVRKNCKKFSTYDQQKKEFGVGDLILFLKNDKRVVGVNNGDTARILSIDNEGNVRARIESTEDKKEITFNINNRGPKAYNFVSHAYAITDYKSQGATTSRLLWFAPTTGGPMSSNTFYVAITRCKEEIGVYTDDADKLKEMVKHDQHKESVLDFVMPKTEANIEKAKDSKPLPEYENPLMRLIPKGLELAEQLYNKYLSTLNPFKDDKVIEQQKKKESVSIDL